MDSTNISSKPLPPGRGFHRSEEFDPPTAVRKPLPGLFIFVGSLVIAFHFFAIVAHALAHRSGPWPTPFDIASPAEPPKFAEAIDNKILPWYLEPLRMTHNYHFETNRTENVDVYFEIKLKDADGKVTKTLKFPDASANAMVQHRQRLLAGALGGDTPAQRPLTERVPSPLVTIWEPVEAETTPQKATYILKKILEHNIPADRPRMRPSEWSLAMAKSYVRYVCREHGAASGELIRHSREAVPAVTSVELVNAVLNMRPDLFTEMVANFGEYRP